jgi:hypothetical protein
MKKLWGSILTLLAILATYIGLNQFTNRSGDSYTPSKRKPPEKTQGGASRNTDKDEYGLGLPPNAGNGAGTRNTDTPKK